MNLSELVDFANKAHQDIGRYMVTVTLSPDQITTDQYALQELSWQSINYGEADADKVPNNKRGIYAFAVYHPSKVLPPHGYVLYIGIAGRDSNRSLQARYRDYLNAGMVMKRPRIARMIGDWHKVLKFFYAPIDDSVSASVLKSIENQLNTALLPPFAEGDLEAKTKAKRRAFR